MVIIDTSLIIDHLRTKKKGQSRLLALAKTHPKDTFAVSILTLQELYAGRSTRNAEMEKNMLATVAPLKILPYVHEVAVAAGKLMRDSAALMTFTDAAIAACALIHHCPLATLNGKDFANIKNLELLSLQS